MNETTGSDLEQWRKSSSAHYAEVLQRGKGSSNGWEASSVAAHCLGTRLSPTAFAGRPRISFMLEYFKHPEVIAKLAAKLQQACTNAQVSCELVANVDNPHEAGDWANVTAGAPAGFVVPLFGDNVHESRGYNVAARVARGDVLIVMQDDQLPPSNGLWLRDMLAVFDAWPRLGILGMNTYRLCTLSEVTNRWGVAPWEPDPKTGVRWTFAQNVDFAPFAIRASTWRDLGGLDEGVSRKGDCGITGDWEMCQRAWVSGWQVGFMAAEGREGFGQGGTHGTASGAAERCWGRQMHVGFSVMGKRFTNGPHHIAAVCRLAWLYNMAVMKPRRKDGNQVDCPYGSESTRWGSCEQPPLDEVLAAWPALQVGPLEGGPWPMAAAAGAVQQGRGAGAVASGGLEVGGINPFLVRQARVGKRSRSSSRRRKLLDSA